MGDNDQRDIMVKLTITIDRNGQVRVEGPINDSILCFGLMEAAKDVIRHYISEKRTQSRITVPTFIMPQNKGS